MVANCKLLFEFLKFHYMYFFLYCLTEFRTWLIQLRHCWQFSSHEKLRRMEGENWNEWWRLIVRTPLTLKTRCEPGGIAIYNMYVALQRAINQTSGGFLGLGGHHDGRWRLFCHAWTSSTSNTRGLFSEGASSDAVDFALVKVIEKRVQALWTMISEHFLPLSGHSRPWKTNSRLCVSGLQLDMSGVSGVHHSPFHCVVGSSSVIWRWVIHFFRIVIIHLTSAHINCLVMKVYLIRMCERNLTKMKMSTSVDGFAPPYNLLRKLNDAFRSFSHLHEHHFHCSFAWNLRVSQRQNEFLWRCWPFKLVIRSDH